MPLDPNIARLIGEIHSDVRHLKNDFEKLGCSENKEKITLLWEYHQSRKVVKFVLLRQAMGYLISGFVASVSTVFAIKG